MASETSLKITNYDGGLPVHTKPEKTGTLTFLPDGKWKLTFGGVMRGTSFFICGATRYPLRVADTGPNSCRVTTCDTQDESIRATFDLPESPGAALRKEIAAHLSTIYKGRPSFAMSNYDGNLPNHPTPERHGTLVLQADGKWELVFGPNREQKINRIFGPISRYPLFATETSSTSCRVTTVDAQDPSIRGTFELPHTTASALRQTVGADATTFLAEFINYDGGLPSKPTATQRGTLVLHANGKWELHGDGMVAYGGINRYAFQISEAGPSACGVAMHDAQDPNIAATFDLPTTSAADLRHALDGAADAARQPAATTSTAVPDEPWWSGIKPSTFTTTLYPVFNRPGGDKLTLKITEEGIQWGQPIGGKTKVPFAAIANITSDHVEAQHGKQHGAIGVGPIGLAVVGATALHNRRAAKADEYRRFIFTDKADKQFAFLTKESDRKIDIALGPTVQAFLAHKKRLAEADATRRTTAAKAKAAADAAAAKARAEAARAAQEAHDRAIAEAAVRASSTSVADELSKLAALKDQGVLSEDEFAAAKARLLS